MNKHARMMVAGLLVCGLCLAAPAWAQETVQEAAQGPEAEEVPAGTTGRLWSASVFGGNMSAGNPVGTVENIFFNTTFKTGSDTAWGLRGGRIVWWRLSAEGEYLRSSPGVIAVLTGPSGEDRTEVSYADLDMSYLAASVLFDAVNGRWVRAFLQFGVGGVFVDGSQPDSDNSAFGILFGGGIEVPIVEDRFFVRADFRGLRADFGLLGLDRGQLVGLEADSLSTNAVWTVGAGVRF